MLKCQFNIVLNWHLEAVSCKTNVYQLLALHYITLPFHGLGCGYSVIHG